MSAIKDRIKMYGNGRRAFLRLIVGIFFFCLTLTLLLQQVAGQSKRNMQPAKSFATTLTQLAGIKVGMDIKEVEKRVGAPLIVNDDFTPVIVKINGEVYNIVFHSRTDGTRYVDLVCTRSCNLNTDRGIGIGSTLMEVWDAYKVEDKAFLRTKGLFALKDEMIAKEAAFVLSTYRPLSVKEDDGYFSTFSFYFDGKTQLVIAMGLYHSEDNW